MAPTLPFLFGLPPAPALQLFLPHYHIRKTITWQRFLFRGWCFVLFFLLSPMTVYAAVKTNSWDYIFFPTKSPAWVVHKGAKKVLLFLPCLQQVNRWLGFTRIHTSSHVLADTLPDSGLSNSSVLSIWNTSLLIRWVGELARIFASPVAVGALPPMPCRGSYSLYVMRGKLLETACKVRASTRQLL